jgi:hypothetical protein
MSEISTLTGKSAKYNIAGMELNLAPRGFEDIDLALDISGEDAVAKKKAVKELIRKTLKEAKPDMTDEEFAKISWEHLAAITEAVLEVNGLKKK